MQAISAPMPHGWVFNPQPYHSAVQQPGPSSAGLPSGHHTQALAPVAEHEQAAQLEPRPLPGDASSLLNPLLPSADVPQLQKRVSDLRVALVQAQQNTSIFQQQVQALHQTVRQKDEENSSLSLQLMQAQQAGALLQGQLGEAAEAAQAEVVRALQQEVAAQVSAQLAAQQELAFLSEQLASCTTELTSKLAAEQEERQRLAAEMGQNRMLCSARARQLEALSGELARERQAAAAAADAAARESHALAQRVAQLQAELAEAQGRCSGYQAQMTSLLGEAAAARGAAAAEQERCRVLGAEVAQLRLQQEWLEGKVSDLEESESDERAARLMAEIKRLRAHGEQERAVLEAALAEARLAQQAAAAQQAAKPAAASPHARSPGCSDAGIQTDQALVPPQPPTQLPLRHDQSTSTEPAGPVVVEGIGGHGYGGSAFDETHWVQRMQELLAVVAMLEGALAEEQMHSSQLAAQLQLQAAGPQEAGGAAAAADEAGAAGSQSWARALGLLAEEGEDEPEVVVQLQRHGGGAAGSGAESLRPWFAGGWVQQEQQQEASTAGASVAKSDAAVQTQPAVELVDAAAGEAAATVSQQDASTCTEDGSGEAVACAEAAGQQAQEAAGQQAALLAAALEELEQLKDVNQRLLAQAQAQAQQWAALAQGGPDPEKYVSVEEAKAVVAELKASAKRKLADALQGAAEAWSTRVEQLETELEALRAQRQAKELEAPPPPPPELPAAVVMVEVGMMAKPCVAEVATQHDGQAQDQALAPPASDGGDVGADRLAAARAQEEAEQLRAALAAKDAALLEAQAAYAQQLAAQASAAEESLRQVRLEAEAATAAAAMEAHAAAADSAERQVAALREQLCAAKEQEVGAMQAQLAALRRQHAQLMQEQAALAARAAATVVHAATSPTTPAHTPEMPQQLSRDVSEAGSAGSAGSGSGPPAGGSVRLAQGTEISLGSPGEAGVACSSSSSAGISARGEEAPEGREQRGAQADGVQAEEAGRAGGWVLQEAPRAAAQPVAEEAVAGPVAAPEAVSQPERIAQVSRALRATVLATNSLPLHRAAAAGSSSSSVYLAHLLQQATAEQAGAPERSSAAAAEAALAGALLLQQQQAAKQRSLEADAAVVAHMVAAVQAESRATALRMKRLSASSGGASSSLSAGASHVTGSSGSRGSRGGAATLTAIPSHASRSSSASSPSRAAATAPAAAPNPLYAHDQQQQTHATNSQPPLILGLRDLASAPGGLRALGSAYASTAEPPPWQLAPWLESSLPWAHAYKQHLRSIAGGQAWKAPAAADDAPGRLYVPANRRSPGSLPGASVSSADRHPLDRSCGMSSAALLAGSSWQPAGLLAAGGARSSPIARAAKAKLAQYGYDTGTGSSASERMERDVLDGRDTGSRRAGPFGASVLAGKGRAGSSSNGSGRRISAYRQLHYGADHGASNSYSSSRHG